MNYGSVQRVYIVSEKDIVLPKQLQEMMIVHSPPDEVLSISTSDHMVMLSKPLKLRDRLLDIAQRYT
ncbi:unnamed protein product [Linum tenue]|nr:unnamed protein product [Linum tenue]